MEPAGRNEDYLGPESVAVALDGTIYAAYSDHNRVQYFDRAGTFLGEWGSEGTGASEFVAAAGLAVGPDGTIYVAD